MDELRSYNRKGEPRDDKLEEHIAKIIENGAGAATCDSRKNDGLSKVVLKEIVAYMGLAVSYSKPKEELATAILRRIQSASIYEEQATASKKFKKGLHTVPRLVNLL